MATDRTIRSRKPGVVPYGWSRTVGLLNPLKAVWWLFTNVRFAIFLLALLTVVSLLGVLIPQKPLNVRGDVVAEEAWLAEKGETFGFFSGLMERLELFDIFRAGWFAVLMGVTVASTGAYILSRIPGVWRAVTKPRRRVPDRYFEIAPSRLFVAGVIDAAALEGALKRRRYKVDVEEEAGAIYLFAQRFQWAQFGTLLTHAAVIVFILAAVVSRVDAFSSDLFLAEGSTLPVFPVRHPEQMQVELLGAHASFAEDGQPLDYRSDLVIYHGGEEVLRCESTVNSPCTYRGYKFHQAAYFGFGAALQVRDLESGNVIYRETLALVGRAPAPHVRVTNADGALLLDEALVMAESATLDGVTYAAALVSLPQAMLTFWLPEPGELGEEKLLVFEPASGPDAIRAGLAEGESVTARGLEISYIKREAVPSLLLPDLPLPPQVGEGGSGKVFLQMSNVVYGTDNAAEGTRVAARVSDAPPLLTISGLEPRPLTLGEGESVVVGPYEYTFLGQREFAGIQVRRDRSDYLVWAGAAMIVAGLMITFWVPRRRFWAKITETGAALAGQAPTHADYRRELSEIAREAGADVAHRSEED
jgi:cytochrome c biogenesis protein ResB